MQNTLLDRVDLRVTLCGRGVSMSISKSDATISLQEVEDVGRQTRRAGGYAVASPHLILWGAIWLVGYTVSGLTNPSLWGLVWMPLVLVGALGGTFLARRSHVRGVPRGAMGGRSLGLAIATAIFFLSIYTVFRPVSIAPYLMLPVLFTALMYVAIGLYGWPRFGWIGFAIFLVSMGGYLFAIQWLPFFLGLSGGGGLMLGGFWLRKV
ncbi:hypothetical protein QH494_24215 [Sphingomonas sp. AR_OL41]|uniref:hypothetical protein n=1 Tax=Sphingomonas sp. AR_OL41 TaxID=3042729 RepID=UPI00248089D2|nr:hypothetical protein [Sphingomonas sp. AR_OL41]MDH7975303.1 hypothetical protein [Sphingomonas sp. AR_OL41]